MLWRNQACIAVLATAACLGACSAPQSKSGPTQGASRCSQATATASRLASEQALLLEQLRATVARLDPEDAQNLSDDDLRAGRFAGSALTAPAALLKQMRANTRTFLYVIVDDAPCFSPGDVAGAKQALESTN